MTSLISAKNISILRGQHLIIRQASLDIPAGQAIHLIGENGSGKTTLLQALAGLLPISAGNIIRHSELLYLGHRAGIKGLLSVTENLYMAARLYHGMNKTAAHAAIPQALAQMGIAHLAQRQARHLSAGQQRRVQLARLWLPSPALWLLDEPLTALDIKTAAVLAAHCENHIDKGGAILLTSHQHFPMTVNKLRQIDLSDLSPAQSIAGANHDWDEDSF